MNEARNNLVPNHPVCHKSFDIKALSHDPSHEPFHKIQFLVPKTGSRRLDGPISRFRFCGENVGRSFVVCSHDLFFRTDKESSIWRQTIMQNLSVPFFYQGQCRMKIEHVLFPSVFFFKITDPLDGRSF